MSGPRQRKSYTPAYRREAAHLVIDTGRPIVQVAREIGVGEALLGRWVALERARTDPPEALDVDERAELARLRTENAELRMDREFLKNLDVGGRLWSREKGAAGCGLVTGLGRDHRRVTRPLVGGRLESGVSVDPVVLCAV